MRDYYIRFELASKQNPKTEVWDVVTVEDGFNLLGEVIGQIKWYGSWRQYAFFPSQNTVFEPKCLRNIIDFIQARMAYRKFGKK